MTEQEKIDSFMNNPEVQALIEEMDCTDDVAEVPAVQMTILDAMKHVINRAEVTYRTEYGGTECYYRYSDAFVEEIRKEADFLAGQFGITSKQVVLFVIILESSKGMPLDAKELSECLKANYVELLSFDGDIKALVKARLVKRTPFGFCVPDEVKDALKLNKAFRRPPVEGLSSLDIMTKLSQLFAGLESREENCREVLAAVDEMVLANPGTSFSRTMDEYGILCRDAVPDESSTSGDFDKAYPSCERMLFYALCFLYHDREEDSVTWWMLRMCLESSDAQLLQSRYMAEQLELQKRAVVTYSGEAGLVDRDHFKIADDVKEKILMDCGGLPDSGKNMPGVIIPDTIPLKKLYFDPEVDLQVSRLGDLLEENRYHEVEHALKSKGLRPGFTCLFYGAPGTGKTETVYQIAKRTGRGIIMVDVSKLKSMWVGESEKNIKLLFAKYARCVKKMKKAPILLFNEADAIFGIRKSGAESAVDKMENSLQNIILQEMENLRGILIATTNLTENLDKAFERRFLYKIHFQAPSVEAKKKIWNALIPELKDDESGKLAAMFAFSGGQIENISRKRIVQSVLTGKEPTYEEVEQMCREESLNNKGEQRRIGF